MAGIQPKTTAAKTKRPVKRASDNTMVSTVVESARISIWASWAGSVYPGFAFWLPGPRPVYIHLRLRRPGSCRACPIRSSRTSFDLPENSEIKSCRLSGHFQRHLRVPHLLVHRFSRFHWQLLIPPATAAPQFAGPCFQTDGVSDGSLPATTSSTERA